MTKKTNLTKDTLNKREDGRAVTSEVLIHLPDSIELKQESDCHVCQNAVWFTESTGDQRPPNLSVYCQIMRSVIWQSGYKNDNILIAKCDGILIDNNKDED
ncbi:relaxosome accessory protein [Salmonella enterica]|nr:relaxosome accessory protein [Salmonella enterica]EEW1918402.1 relaxosome accessory protein [Escherichia coli]EBJ7489233.1 relaxosome accessory protein [Salmonella enterica]ECC5251728.1 relaxosome accessory protein [Salmonella enterica]ECG0550720.1 relaxosome accessory protein [Salmonella enterica]